ncbi:MAG TPA: DUF2834 domain-containing protein [Candidatus Kryptonia bacterium]|nr:DUF2834 domain-containing protein [Candidatus Kryptonia bacterium]
MNAKQIGIGVVLADFVALNAYVVYQYGYVGFIELVTANAATTAALVDLVIALSMVTVWMVRDARERGVSSIPYVILTLVLGSVGPLLYLFRRAGSEKTAGVRVAAASARG